MTSARLTGLLSSLLSLASLPPRLLAPLVVILGILGVGVALPCGAASEGNGQEERQRDGLTVERAELDWGTLIQGDSGEVVFILRNRSDRPLVIEKVSGLCTCLSFQFEPQIAASAEGRLRVGIDSRPLSGANLSKVIYLQVQAGPRLELRATGTVLPLLGYPPRSSQVTGFPGTTLRGEIEVRAGTEHPVQLQSVACTRSDVEVRWRAVAAGDRYKIEVSMAAAAGASVVNCKLQVQFRCRDRDEVLEIPLSLRTLGIYRVVPDRVLVFSRSETAPLLEKPPRPVTRSVIVEVQAPGVTLDPVRAEITRGPPRALRAEVVPLTAGRRYRIDVTLLEHVPARIVTALLNIDTGVSGDARRQIKIRILF